MRNLLSPRYRPDLVDCPDVGGETSVYAEDLAIDDLARKRRQPNEEGRRAARSGGMMGRSSGSVRKSDCEEKMKRVKSRKEKKTVSSSRLHPRAQENSKLTAGKPKRWKVRDRQFSSTYYVTYPIPFGETHLLEANGRTPDSTPSTPRRCRTSAGTRRKSRRPAPQHRQGISFLSPLSKWASEGPNEPG